jgi:hypothetical protein
VAAANNTTARRRRHVNETDSSSLIEEKVRIVRGLNFSSLEVGKTSHRANLTLSTLEWCISACLQLILPADRPAAQQLVAALAGAQDALLRMRNDRPDTDTNSTSPSLPDLQQIVNEHLHRGCVLPPTT